MTASAVRPEPGRRRRLRERLREARLDGLLVSRAADIRYLSGFAGSSGLLLVEPGLATLITDFRYEEQARDEAAPDVRLEISSDGLFDAVGARLAEESPGRRIGFQAGALTVQDRQELEERAATVLWEPAGPLVEEQRAVKDPNEIGHIAEAAGLAERALAATLPLVREGMTERDLAAELEYRLRREGSGPLPFDPIVAAGARSALPHARPGGNRLRENDLLLLDFGAARSGYCCDLTRVFVLGAAAEWQQRTHAAVREACERAIAAAGPGVAARDVDAAAREHLSSLGLGERFGHGTGHGIGLEVHEEPRIHRRATGTLAPGNVVTIEPGVYLPGRGGIRLEQDVVIERGGVRVLTGSSIELMEL
ncbi:MAG: Xaa-Pro peptidase family protein [Gemmatimonadota bacterium]|nr:Xaa-Pro peptidase family protein [Gemmatimonadota bacterium]